MNAGLSLYDILVWTFIGFISGSVPWSLICVKAFSGMDVRSTGDGNQGPRTHGYCQDGQLGLYR